MQPVPLPSLYTPSLLGEEQVVTRSSLLKDLHRAGIHPGDTLCVHSACSKLGYVVGGTRTVLDCLLECVGYGGTLMMPTFSGDLSDPAEWLYPAIPPHLVDDARESLPGYDPLLTPTKGMGSLPELFRHRPEAIRSPHPQSSFTALGPNAGALCGKHPLSYRFGPESPLGSLVRLDGKLLLLGAPWNTVSLFYLTEFFVPNRKEKPRSAPVWEGDRTVWKTYQDLVYSNLWQDAVVELIDSGIANRFRIGLADCVLFPARQAVEKVVEWRSGYSKTFKYE